MRVNYTCIDKIKKRQTWKEVVEIHLISVQMNQTIFKLIGGLSLHRPRPQLQVTYHQNVGYGVHTDAPFK